VTLSGILDVDLYTTAPIKAPTAITINTSEVKPQSI
jgi:hypothetical protein